MFAKLAGGRFVWSFAARSCSLLFEVHPPGGPAVRRAEHFERSLTRPAHGYRVCRAIERDRPAERAVGRFSGLLSTERVLVVDLLRRLIHRVAGYMRRLPIL